MNAVMNFRERGQSMVEYLVAVIVIFGIFALPFENGQPLIVMFLEAVRTAYQNFSSAVSVP